MAYNKAQVQEVGAAIVGVIDAVKDGVGVADLGAAMTLMTAFAAASDEFKGDTDAAILHLVAAIADGIGDQRVDVA